MSGRFVVRKEIVLAAAPGQVFAALVEPEQLVRFWPFKEVVSGGEVGSAIVFRGEAGGAAFTDHGVIEVLEPPHRFRYNYWSDNHGTPDTPENRMVVDYRLVPEGAGCRLQLSHENLLSAERVAMMDGVWDYLLALLRSHVEGAGRADSVAGG